MVASVKKFSSQKLIKLTVNNIKLRNKDAKTRKTLKFKKKNKKSKNNFSNKTKDTKRTSDTSLIKTPETFKASLKKITNRLLMAHHNATNRQT